MRWVAIIVTCAGASVPGIARADLTAGELQARGEALAKDGRYGEAIAVFKDADRIEVRASHACLISLGYARRALWTQAEIWLAACHGRAKPDDPVPEWGGELDTQVRAHFSDPGVAPVAITVEPAVPGTRVRFADYPDDGFAPSTIHVGPGHHQIIVTAPGYADETRDVDLADTTERHVAVVLQKPARSPGDPTRARLVTAGVVVGGAGFVSYGLMGFSYLRLHDNRGFGSGIETTYDVTRVTTIGLWVIGGGLLIAGLLRHEPESAVVSAAPLAGGAMVTVGWQR